jgi:hypothetical protein
LGRDYDNSYRATHRTAIAATPHAVLNTEARTEREMFPSSKYSKMIDHTKNAAGKIVQKIPISTALELLPDWRIAQIAVTVSRTADVNDAMTVSTKRPMSDIIGKVRFRSGRRG